MPKKIKKREGDDSKKTTITLYISTKEKIQKLGFMSETFDELLDKMVNFILEREKTWFQKKTTKKQQPKQPKQPQKQKANLPG